MNLWLIVERKLSGYGKVIDLVEGFSLSTVIAQYSPIYPTSAFIYVPLSQVERTVNMRVAIPCSAAGE